MIIKVTTFFTLLLTVSIFSFGCSPSFEGDSFEEGLERGYANLTVVYIQASGFAYEDENGHLTGVAIDILREFADFVHYSQGIDINYTFFLESDFSSFYNKVRDSKNGVFGIGNVTITENRKLELKFSPPYLTNIAVLISNSEATQLRELNTISQDFSELKGLAFKGTLHEERIKNLKSKYWSTMEIEYSTSNREIIQKIAADNTYFSYIDIYNYWLAAERGEPLQQHQVADLASERFGIIMPMNTDWDDLITDFFDQGQGFRTSRTYRAILEKHLGTELTEKLERARIEATQF